MDNSTAIATLRSRYQHCYDAKYATHEVHKCINCLQALSEFIVETLVAASKQKLNVDQEGK